MGTENKAPGFLEFGMDLERVKAWNPRRPHRRVHRLGLALYKLRWTLAVWLYRRGLFRMSRRVNAGGYWAAYAAELGAAWERGDRLPAEQGAEI